MKIDLGQFRQIYLQESADHVAAMETALLALRLAPDDVEVMNAIFRSAHSLKGGAGSFGMETLVQFTHALENLLDSLRSLEVPATAEVISLLLQSVDLLRVMLDAGPEAAMPEAALRISAQFESLLAAAGANPVRADEARKQITASPAAPDGGAPGGLTLYRVDFRPHREMFASGANPILLLRNLAALGTVSVCRMHVDELPPLEQLDPLQCYLRWTIELASPKPEEVLREVFEFVDHLADVSIVAFAEPSPSQPGALMPPAIVAAESPEAAAEERPRAEARKTKKPVPAVETSTIRVATEKVDRLIDLVGELVIAQVMTAQMIEDFAPARLQKLRDAVTAMQRSTRELHERAMAVRMMPIDNLFQRYARVVYDIAQSTGKQIRLEREGEETEIDKSMLELLADPLTHLVRNAADHGIEAPATRAACGKPEEGVIALRAFHHAGRIVIEISDDGAGIDTERVRAKAVERGLIGSGLTLSEDQLRMLIFEPGFSTSEAVTDFSGRGVGMDVVKRNVEQLSGTVGLASVPGSGSTVSIELPLTLSILEGLLVRVADRTLVLPLLVVVEAVSLRTNRIQQVAERGEVILIREESIPVLRLRRFLGIEGAEPAEQNEDNRLVVVVDAGRNKIGLTVDELLGQQQVVVKSLEKHLHKVEGLMGATILGDGRVAPILDVATLSRLNLFSLAGSSAGVKRRSPAPAAPGITAAELTLSRAPTAPALQAKPAG